MKDAKWYVGGTALIIGLIWMFLCTDWFFQPLSIEQIYQKTEECRKAWLQSYVSERNFNGDPVNIKCRGFE